MKKDLEILGVEDTKEGKPRVTSNGKNYARVKTNEGWMSCFNKVAWEELKEFIDKKASVEVIESGNFSNIMKCYGKPEDEEVEIVKVPQEIKVSSGNKFTTMYVSYAKDIYCALLMSGKMSGDLQQDMDCAIKLVKQAKDAFA